MSLTSANLVGYLRAEFTKSARIRVWLFFAQLFAALPAAISVVIPDSDAVVLYGLAVAGIILLIAWCGLNEFYVSANSAAQAARRAALLLGGFDEALSPSEIQSLRRRFTVTSAHARSCEKKDYYETKEPPGAARLAEMVEESAVYSEHMQRISAKVMLGILLLFGVVFLGIALFSIPMVNGDSGMVVARVILALMVFVLSADVLGAWRRHQAAADEISQILNRLMVADRAGYPMLDVLLAFVDYNAAVEAAPESVPYIYKFCQKDLEKRWSDYQLDRAEARIKWRGAK